MVFNSFGFAIFLPLCFLAYWFLFSGFARRQNNFLLVSSLIFYCFADWRFLLLLLISAAANYYFAKLISRLKSEKKKRALFRSGLFFNILILGYFKYYHFFVDSFIKLLGGNPTAVHILVPLGISFYTFQVLAYIIDVYNEEAEPCTNFLDFLTYITYFPKILAGPIERIQNFLPQIEHKRTFHPALATDGMRQFLWGLFAKIVIADNCAALTNKIFDNYTSYNGFMLLTGSFFYAFQVYCDFSGYSNMAIGVSKLFGIRLMPNFIYPFFSVNIGDYWKKWHISLSSWMMTYVFTPLSFKLRKMKKWGLIISIIATFVIVGLWHGANWTFILFGFLHGLYFIPLILANPLSKSSSLEMKAGRVSTVLKMISLFVLVMLTMIVFRVPTVTDAVYYFAGLFDSRNFFAIGEHPESYKYFITLFFIFFLMLTEWNHRDKEHALQLPVRPGTRHTPSSAKRVARWALYGILVLCIASFLGNEQDFIYFKF